MSLLKHILAATDLSSPARQAADRAAWLAQTSGAQLRLMHVLSAGVAAQLQQLLGLGTALEATLVEQTRDELKALAGELGVKRGVTIESALTEGAVANEIVRAAQELPADLLVLGARGKGFLRRTVIGSTAERLLRKATRPVLVVKQRAHEPYRRVLVALDFSPWSVPLVGLARAMAPDAHLVLLSAYEVPFEGKLRFASVPRASIEAYRAQARLGAEEQLYGLADDAGLAPFDWTPCLAHGDASLAIVEHEQELACDLIVIGKHGRHMLEELLLGSVTSHVLAECVGDVLVSTSTQVA